MTIDHGSDRHRDGRRRASARAPAHLLVIAALLALPAVGAAQATARADTISPAMIALGERIFLGRVGGAICTTCHGKDAKGVPGLGPDLTDRTWLHGDGSLEFLRTIIRTGVMKPKAGAGVMPPSGGVPLTPEQLQAVAAYVFSLSQSKGS